MNLVEIEKHVAELDFAKGFDLIYDLLLAYDLPKSGVTLLRAGSRDLSTNANELLWKDRVFYRFVEDPEPDLHSLIDAVRDVDVVKRAHPRFLVVQDGRRLLAVDTRTATTLDIPLVDLPIHSAFFMPWAGIEKTQLESLNYADIKAAEKMARLYDEIAKHNAIQDERDVRNLNVFFSRLLFCFFAEDTRVFEAGSFTDTIASLTQSDGSDTGPFLDQLFEVLDTAPVDRVGVPSHLLKFGYVNGRLFEGRAPAPRFSVKARRIILECATLDWSVINPDIFGSMIQAVVQPGQREGLGMHYTSVENIMKVIRPLFLNDLHERFDRADTVAKLQRLLDHICDIKVFDPACGSGNFLIIAYKELRKLEHRILQRMGDLDPSKSGLFKLSGIQLDHFYGIEIDDFAHQIAVLSLWLAKHQMNVEFQELFGVEISLIPLKDTGNIVCGNAARLDWGTVCPRTSAAPTFVLGNPPYRGAKYQTRDQKADFVEYFGTKRYPRNLDYVALWFLKGAEYVSAFRANLGFVATSSLVQGDHVALLWPRILDGGVKISFAHQSFAWSNQAKANAGVSCVVVGLSSEPPPSRKLYTSDGTQSVNNINPYLRATPSNTIVRGLTRPLGALPPMTVGSRPNDGGHLILTPHERTELLEASPEAGRFVLEFIGAKELLDGLERYCIWIKDGDLEVAEQIPEIAKRLAAVRAVRASGGENARSVVDTPHRFGHRSYRATPSIVIPRHSSERRQYIPMGYLSARAVPSDAVLVVYDAEPWLFGLLHSRMHMSWVEMVSSRLESRYRYSAKQNYNTFPVPVLRTADMDGLGSRALAVLEAREKSSHLTLAQMYDPGTMPASLLSAHEAVDAFVDSLYARDGFASDQARAQALLSMYERLIAEAAEHSDAESC